MKRRRLKAVDLFCGAGGSTTGAIASGCVDVVLAVNHWRVAIYSHETNHPGTRHICARIDDIDPRHDRSIPNHDILMASPECTHFSVARGGAPIEDQRRATPWHVQIWAEAKRPKWIVVENVREFRDWGPLGANGRPLKSQKGKTFRAWVKAIESLGYQVDHQILNASEFGEATTRRRLFVIARRGSCRRDIPWPEATHQGRPAAEIIDWSRPCPSIFSRKRPLADKTLKRIEAGLRKFVGNSQADAFLVQYHNGPDGHRRTYPLTDPVPTLDTQPRYAIAKPYLFQIQGPGARDPNYDGCQDPLEPMRTITTRGNHGVVMPFLAEVNHGGDHHRCRAIRDPLGTVTTKRGTSLVLPFITKYNGTGGANPVTEPLHTVSTRARYGLATVELMQTMQELGVVDIGFRMLDVDELAAAMGFPAGYFLHGTKAEQIKQIGNAVAPGVMKAICQTIAS